MRAGRGGGPAGGGDALGARGGVRARVSSAGSNRIGTRPRCAGTGSGWRPWGEPGRPARRGCVERASYGWFRVRVGHEREWERLHDPPAPVPYAAPGAGHSLPGRPPGGQAAALSGVASQPGFSPKSRRTSRAARRPEYSAPWAELVSRWSPHTYGRAADAPGGAGRAARAWPAPRRGRGRRRTAPVAGGGGVDARELAARGVVQRSAGAVAAAPSATAVISACPGRLRAGSTSLATMVYATGPRRSPASTSAGSRNGALGAA